MERTSTTAQKQWETIVYMLVSLSVIHYLCVAMNAVSSHGYSVLGFPMSTHSSPTAWQIFITSDICRYSYLHVSVRFFMALCVVMFPSAKGNQIIACLLPICRGKKLLKVRDLFSKLKRFLLQKFLWRGLKFKRDHGPLFPPSMHDNRC